MHQECMENHKFTHPLHEAMPEYYTARQALLELLHVEIFEYYDPHYVYTTMWGGGLESPSYYSIKKFHCSQSKNLQLKKNLSSPSIY